jgi:hypothetical protein
MLVKAVNKPRHSGPSALATLTSSRLRGTLYNYGEFGMKLTIISFITMVEAFTEKYCAKGV